MKTFISAVKPMKHQLFETSQYSVSLFNENNSYLMFELISKSLRKLNARFRRLSNFKFYLKRNVNIHHTHERKQAKKDWDLMEAAAVLVTNFKTVIHKKELFMR